MKKIFFFCAVILIWFSSIMYANTSVFFSPKGGCTDAIISHVASAKSSIDIAMYSFSSRPIVQELIKAKDRGIVIRIILDKAQEKQKYSSSRFLIKNGFSVKYDQGSGLMHNKYAIIDNSKLITGSFNWTRQAEMQNQENLLILDGIEIIDLYRKRFDYLWDIAKLGFID